MPNEVSTPVDLPPFDFQLRGAVYNPLDWYWVMDDGRIYSSARETMIAADDQQYLIWTALQPTGRATLTAIKPSTRCGRSWLHSGNRGRNDRRQHHRR